MAHRNIKITRDIVQTCNKLRAFNKLDQYSLQPHVSESSKTESPPYSVQSNDINCSAFNPFCQNGVTNADTIPSTILPEFNATGYVTGNKDPFIIDPDKNLTETEFITGQTPLPLTTSIRFYSTSNNKHNGEPSCKPSKKCVRNPNCPKFSIDDCTPARGSNCKRLYQDPHCTKKMAPYPSYSELCAFRMEEDPSECQQCPWQRCRGVEDIKPQGKKSYHTSARDMNMAMIPTQNSNFFPLILPQQCDARKEPCKEPPSKCKKREKTKKEKCPPKKKKEKTCDLMNGQPWIISGNLRELELQKLDYGKTRLASLKEILIEPTNLAQQIIYNLKDCPERDPKCPKWEIVPPDLDYRINDDYPLLLSKEHDKGHPPPCEPTSNPSSRQCPADTPKKKYKKERDLFESEYRRNPRPYSEDDRRK